MSAPQEAAAQALTALRLARGFVSGQFCPFERSDAHEVLNLVDEAIVSLNQVGLDSVQTTGAGDLEEDGSIETSEREAR